VPTVFTRIINGEIPGRFVWRDDRAVGFLSIQPLKPGHTLVVPRKEVDHWIDLEPDLAQHLMAVGHAVGKALQQAFRPVKVGLMIAGLEVPHCHVHVVPINGMRDLDFANQDNTPNPAALDDAAEKIRNALRSLGFHQVAER
jgi:histidine triad (HIT) family protein